jgi:hypothetical protein
VCCVYSTRKEKNVTKLVCATYEGIIFGKIANKKIKMINSETFVGGYYCFISNEYKYISKWVNYSTWLQSCQQI